MILKYFYSKDAVLIEDNLIPNTISLTSFFVRYFFSDNVSSDFQCRNTKNFGQHLSILLVFL